MVEENYSRVSDIFSSYSAEGLIDFFHYVELLGRCDAEDVEVLKQIMNDMSWEARERELQEDEGTIGGPKK